MERFVEDNLLPSDMPASLPPTGCSRDYKLSSRAVS